MMNYLLTIKRGFILGSTIMVLLFSVVQRASADSYDVTATIPYAAPTLAPTIDASLNGITVSTDIYEIFGTCEHALPATIVSIWRTSTLIGSVQCESNNTYRLNVTLLEGVNSLLVRSSSLSNAYGPDGNTVSITYASASPVEPSQPLNPSQDTTTPASGGGLGGSGETSELQISSTNPYELINSSNEVSVQITVGGGTGPYTIVLNWGDGSTETLIVDDPGTFSFTHVYTTSGIYRVVATVTDILGVSKMYQFIVASTTSATDADKQNTEKKDVTGETSTRLNYILFGSVVGVVFLLILISTFILGRRYQFKKMQAQMDAYEEKLGKITKGKRL